MLISFKDLQEFLYVCVSVFPVIRNNNSIHVHKDTENPHENNTNILDQYYHKNVYNSTN